jgi:hypothetical protein
VAVHSKKEGSGLVFDELLVEVNTPFHIIVGGGPKASGIGGYNVLLGKCFGAFIGSPLPLLTIHNNKKVLI